jgi:hypothetical protein
LQASDIAPSWTCLSHPSFVGEEWWNFETRSGSYAFCQPPFFGCRASDQSLNFGQLSDKPKKGMIDHLSPQELI